MWQSMLTGVQEMCIINKIEIKNLGNRLIIMKDFFTLKNSFIGILFFSLLMISTVVQAQEPRYNIDTLNVIPTGDEFSDQEFINNSQIFSQNVDERSFLNFEVRLPNMWSESFLNSQKINPLNTNFLTDIGRYVSPPYGDKRAFFGVQAIIIKKEIFAEDWFRNQVLTNSYNIKAINIKSSKEIEAIYTALEGDIAFAVRAKVFIAGDVLYFIRHALPVSVFSKFAVSQAKVMNSFKLLSPKRGAIEKERRFAVLGALSFFYPSSWQIKEPNFSNLDHLSVELHRVERQNITFGRFLIEAIKKKQGVELQAFINSTIKKLGDKGYKLEELIEQRTATLPQGFYGGLIEVYGTYGNLDNLEQEFWFSYFENEEYYFFFTMLTPTREVAYEDWSKNRAVYLNTMARVQ